MGEETTISEAEASAADLPGMTYKARRFRLAGMILVVQTLMVWWIVDSEIARNIYLICYALMMPTTLYLLAARILQRHLPFSTQELLLGYIVLTATLPLLGFGGQRFLITGLGYIVHFSEGQPGWSDYLPGLARLPILHDTTAIHTLYRGGSAVPWFAWVIPIAFWSAYLLLLCGVWFGLAACLHRIWIRQERLTFPITSVPLEIMDTGRNIARVPAFWIGLAIPMVLQSLLVVHDWYPTVPCITLRATDMRSALFTSPPWNALPDIQVGYYPMAIGLAYFVPSDVSFSCLFFWLTARLAYVAGAAWGVGVGGGGAAARFPFPTEQAAGAWIGFAGLALAGARFHWAGLMLSLTQREKGALFGWMTGAGVCVALAILLMVIVGVPLWLSIGMMAVYVSYALAGARVRAEAGGVWTVGPLGMTPLHLTRMVGSFLPASGADIIAAAHFTLIQGDIRAVPLPYFMEGLKIAETVGLDWRTVTRWVAAFSVTALALGWWRSLSDFYALGAATAHSNDFALYMARTVMQDADGLVRNPVRGDAPGMIAVLFGAGVTVVLSALRMRILAFPLHPVGYVLCNTFSMNHFFVPFLIAWTTKTLALRFGGGKAYRASMPFFVGLTLGDISIQALWALFGRVFDVPIYPFLQ